MEVLVGLGRLQGSRLLADLGDSLCFIIPGCLMAALIFFYFPGNSNDTTVVEQILMQCDLQIPGEFLLRK